MAAVLETAYGNDQAEPMALIDLISCMISTNSRAAPTACWSAVEVNLKLCLAHSVGGADQLLLQVANGPMGERDCGTSHLCATLTGAVGYERRG
jgi:hypothetical protein